MAKILSINQYGEIPQDNLFKNLWESFTSLDKFTKSILISFLLIIVTVSFLVSNRLNLLQHAAPNGLVTFVDNTNTAISQTTTPDVRIQLAPPDDWTLTKADTVPHAYAQEADSCLFDGLSDGQNVDDPTPFIRITATRSNASYLQYWNNDVLIAQMQSNTMSSSPLQRQYHADANGDYNLECRIQTEKDTGGTTVFSKKITLHSITTPSPSTTLTPQASTPTSTPLVTSTPVLTLTPTSTTTLPTPTPGVKKLFQITIQNTDNRSGGDIMRTITDAQSILTAMSAPITWKINPLTEDETSAIRTIQVIYSAHIEGGQDVLTTIAASITLARAPTPTPPTTTTDNCTFKKFDIRGNHIEYQDGQVIRYTEPIIITATRSNPSYYLTLYVNGDNNHALSLQDDNLNGFGSLMGSSDGPIRLECRVQTTKGTDATTLFSKKITLNKTTPPAPTATNDDYCRFDGLTDGQVVGNQTPNINVTASASNPSYQLKLQIGSNISYSKVQRSSTSPIDMNVSALPDGSLLLKCSILAYERDDSSIVFSKKITLYKTSSTTPTPQTTTPTPTPPTATPTLGSVVGDVDGNRCLNQTDFDILRQAIKTQTVQQGVTADLNRDGKTDIKDANVWFVAIRLGTHRCQQ